MNQIDTIAQAITALQYRIYTALRNIQTRALMIFWAIDHMALSVCTLGNVRPYEMISSALWVLEQDGKFFGFLRQIVDFLLRPLGPHHCRSSYEWQIHIYEGKKP